MDKDGDGHYDVLSALQKSIRGSDVDASLHYAARLIEAGDLPSLARRLTVIAYEDIGLANPEAQIHTVTALDAAQKIGFPEARILIANVVIDLALSPKSNSAYVAMDKALADLKTSGHLPIPRHLRDGHYSGSKELGNAQDYLYPHNYPGNWVKQDYLPEKIRNHHYFQAEDTGKYERALAQRKEAIDRLRKIWNPFQKIALSSWFFLKKWYHISIETLWCTTSHLSVDRLFFVLLGKQKSSNSM